MFKREVKYLAVILAAAAFLSACADEQEQKVPASGNNEISTVRDNENSEKNEDTQITKQEGGNPENDPDLITDRSKYPTNLYGAAGDKIGVDEITELRRFEEDGENSPWRSAGCDGFVYLAEPTGINFNSIDNADSFNVEDNSFNGSPTESSAVYKRYKAGEEICGLTIKEASVYFAYEEYPIPFDEQYFKGGTVSFDGEKQLTGYIVILSDELYGIGGKGDVVFIPDNDSQILPVLNYNAVSADKGVFSTCLSFSSTIGDFSYKSEYGILSCGNIDSYDSSWFLGEEHNKPLKVKLTVENIRISSSIDWITSYTVKIKDISFD